MQDIFQDFVIWLLKFLVISASLLTAARLWDLRRRRHRQASSIRAAKPPQQSAVKS